jgi:Ni,Fe-hydrogenase I cytochrome b subunit
MNHLPLTRRRTYGLLQRILHWWIALATTGLIVTGVLGTQLGGGSEKVFVRGLHIFTGNLLVVGFVGRILWGIIGPSHAKFSALLYVKSWISLAKSPRILTADGDFGHHPQASLSYIFLYGILLMGVASGLGLAATVYGEGLFGSALIDYYSRLDLLETVHGGTVWLIGFFILTHIGAMIFHESRDHIPIVQSMFSGYQYRSLKPTTREQDSEKIL